MTGNSTGNWRDRFEPRRPPTVLPSFEAEPPQTPHPRRPEQPIVDPFGGEGALSPRPQPALSEGDGPDIDPAIYRPWILQRGRSRPVLMLDLRRYDAKVGHWTGWAMSYPHLIAMDYTADRLLSLDFGTRQFMIEGVGLDELARQIQQGSVLAVHEYVASVWPNRPAEATVSAIRKLEREDNLSSH